MLDSPAMRNPTARLSRLLWLSFILASTVAVAVEPDEQRFYREKIAPVLQAQCYKCHSADADEPKGGLRLDSRASMLEGGDSGPAVVPGNIDESLLIQALRHEGGLQMPPKKGKLPEQTIADFETWVSSGAHAPSETAPSAASKTEDARAHWAFQPVRKADPPRVAGTGWVRTPIDAFILARLEAERWGPSPEASRADWIRRVTFDLTGLPPSPEEIEAFEADAAPEAFERVADRLLASPRHGERWAQHWLDVVRYAETEGYEYDRTVPEAWRFRDYVIESLNRDKPFDRFVVEQIAGDEIGPTDRECLTASIFHRLGPVRRNAGDADIALSRNEVLTERTDILGTAFLGLTVGCARCHNHKLEPISQKDYYQLQAYLAATEERNIDLAPAGEKAAVEAKTKALTEQIQRLKRRVRNASGAERERLKTEIEDLEEQVPAPLATIPSTWNDFERRTPIHVLKRGVWENKGEGVGPRPPGILAGDDAPELPADVRDPRTRLAAWLTSPGHPLTARVVVNRLWQHHFGAGIVRTVNDFGTKGDRPSHPELLDWLAVSLVENGWRFKPLHRMIVLSSTYRQSSRSVASEAAGRDPANRLLWRYPRRRLDAEEVRDAMLAVSGRLNLKPAGASVMVPVDQELVQQLYKPSQWQVASDPLEHDRRSIYLIAKRNLRLPFMETFDAPALMTSCARREPSTHAPQALELLNGRLSNDLASAFAVRLQNETCGVPDRVVDRAFRLALGRAPTPRETTLSLEFLRSQPLKEFALAVLNLNEFVYAP